MKYLATLIIFSIQFGLFASDTTYTYLDHSFSKTKLSQAIYYEKRVETDDGLWYAEIYRFDGVAGNVYSRGYYQSKKSQIKEGKFEEYHRNGSLHKTGEYANNEKVGYWDVFYSSGEKESYGYYNASGEKDSIWVNLHKNGEVQNTGMYSNGNKTGEWLGYFEDGSTNTLKMYNDSGKLDGKYVIYGKAGLVFDTGAYKNGERDGEWKYFFSEGKPSGVVTYDNGEPIESEYWNEDGTVVDQDQQVVNREPAFPGGVKEMYKYLGNNTKYPKVAMENNYQGRVYVSFVVEKSGKINEVKILRGVHESIDEEAIRVVESMPKWSYGISQNRIVRVRYNLPIVFKLQ